MEQVPVGLIGTGRMGQNHCRMYSNMRNARIVALAVQKLNL